MTVEELRSKYIDAAVRFNAEADKQEKILLYLSFLRLICFAGGLFLIILFFTKSSLAGLLMTLTALMAFLVLLKLYGDHSRKKEFTKNLALVNSREADALDGKISQFDPGKKYTDSSHDFSHDIDLFGDNSVFQYLNRTVTEYGSDILAGWLSDPYPLAALLAERQEIIRELAGKDTWRHRLMASGMKVPFSRDGREAMLKWLNDDQPAQGTLPLILLTALPVATITALALVAAGILNHYYFIALFLVNLIYVGSRLRITNRIHNALSGNYLWLSSVQSLTGMIKEETFVSPAINSMKDQLSGKDISADVAVGKLGRLIRSFDSRLNIMAGFLLNGLLLWDFQCTRRLEKWKAKYRPYFRVWLEIIGKTDAYSSLANMAYNNPHFSWPLRSDSEVVFAARDLGHPLIGENKRISNDFEIEKRGSVCIITGANMAGKSTFLRTVAVNCILAMTGSPVCASELVFSPARLFTSMRTTDSLSDNESYFYAELKRLKLLKDKVENGEPVLFILDEILKGTNSADKSLGSRLFLEKLLVKGGTGLIATHDTSLGELEKEHPGQVFNMCFEIAIEGETVIFDYRLSRGITKRMNAALLMRQMGILDKNQGLV